MRPDRPVVTICAVSTAAARPTTVLPPAHVRAPGATADVLIGAAALTVGAATALVRGTRSVAAPLTRWSTRPPGVPDAWTPAHAGAGLARRCERVGALLRVRLAAELASRLDVLLPVLVEELARRVDLTELVLRHVDLDAVVAAVDLDAAAARLDVDAVVAAVDLDAAAARLDVDAVVARADVDAVVARADLNAAASGLDVDSVVARVDLDGVVDRLDLTALVLDGVDLASVVSAALDRLDLEQVSTIAATVVDAIDLPDIIRSSSGTMATDTVRGVRMRGMAADDALSRARNRVLRRG